MSYSARMIMSAHIFVEVISTYASVTNKFRISAWYHYTISPFDHIGATEHANYAVVLDSKTQGKYGERNHKAATLNKPTFNLLTS